MNDPRAAGRSMRDQEVQFFRSADPIDEKRQSMLISGRTQGLSLTLGPRRRSECTFSEREGSASVSSMSSVLQQSRFLKPARELLDEVASVSSAVELSFDEDPSKVRPFGVISLEVEQSSLDADVRVVKLVALLDELENRYRQYFHRMERVISSFEIVAGSGAAGSYTGLTIQAMTRHFANLRNAIITQIHRHSFKHSPAPADKNLRLKREALQKLGIIQNKQAWRPLKGLPEDSVLVLRSWLFENFLHPYPDDNEKLKLVSKTGLTRNQISNWFINARVRIWKPMIEEMYREEFSEDSGNMSPCCRSNEET
ncbi:BEL1-like homeodomain protein 11 [Zingiber officinale]|uniref:Homeobox domain-containing protein n=1 Tax=Zingiber officinale TaxID=94328 RepID=A0A8J5GFC5_ZINOF|nr:BEL1-like homeodomain protein 11 [Zingiber officinale]XP_042392716.1 BEL1-like homeodomain protein 11 [Zingiber officinale]XP_042392717.1 BEL1-like homeodomain protein 11 [Zingiber officinale]KAG6502687.1 hypothetical protein ZIOFF_034973 [Zingiber officinale]